MIDLVVMGFREWRGRVEEEEEEDRVGCNTVVKEAKAHHGL